MLADYKTSPPLATNDSVLDNMDCVRYKLV